VRNITRISDTSNDFFLLCFSTDEGRTDPLFQLSIFILSILPFHYVQRCTGKIDNATCWSSDQTDRTFTQAFEETFGTTLLRSLYRLRNNASDTIEETLGDSVISVYQYLQSRTNHHNILPASGNVSHCTGTRFFASITRSFVFIVECQCRQTFAQCSRYFGERTSCSTHSRAQQITDTGSDTTNEFAWTFDGTLSNER
jgi:hypothetical protein